MNSFLSRSRWAAIGAAVAVSLGGGAVFVANATLDVGQTFFPITPCRLLDTRANTLKGVAVTAPKDSIGDASIGVTPNLALPQSTNDLVVYFHPSQFAKMGDCQNTSDIPPDSDPTAIVMNVTAVGAGSATYLTIYPWQDAINRPFVSQLNPVPNHHPFVNMITVGLTNEFNEPGSRAFRIYNHVGRVNVIIDVVGFYLKD